MSFPQLGYQYIRPLYPSERPGAAGGSGGSAGARGGPGAGASELAASGSLSNVLSSVYGAPYAAAAAAAAAQGYGAFLPYAAELPIFPQLVRARGAREGGVGAGAQGELSARGSD